MEQGGDIELDDLKHAEYTRSPQELQSESNTPSDEDQLTTYDDEFCYSSQTELLVTRPVDYRDSSSQPCRNIEALRPEELPTPSLVQKCESNHPTSYLSSHNPNAPISRSIERTVQSLDSASNQPKHTFEHPEFFAGELVPHTGKGKGKIPTIEQDSSPNGDGHPYNLLQRRTLYPSLLASLLQTDAQFERRQYHRKKYQRLRSEARFICTAVRRDKCRIHGRLFQKDNAQHQGSDEFDVGHMSTRGFINDVFELDESTIGACGTAFELSDYAEEAGKAAQKKRERDRNTLICLEGMIFLFLCTLGIAAIAISVVEQT